jgi:hypothetical protein
MAAKRIGSRKAQCPLLSPSKRDLLASPTNARSALGRLEGTPAANVRTFLREGGIVRDKDASPKAPEGIVKGLRRAFPLPASGAFDDLLKAIDVADARRRVARD